MVELQLFITTFNCGKKIPIQSDFTKSLKQVLPSDLSDLYIFGFQELCSILDATDKNKINRHFLRITNNLITCLQDRYGVEAFEIVSIAHFGAVGLVIISPFMSNVDTIFKSNGHPVGYYYTNLKGGIGIRVSYKKTEITFICVHLNAGEQIQHMLRRNLDLTNILKCLSFDDGWCVFKPNCHCFIMGDLNYRTTGAFNCYGKSRTAGEQELSASRNENPLIRHDELSILQEHGVIFEDLKEAPVRFNPSYKFIVGTNSYHNKRKPSYCDRILFLSYNEDDQSDNYDVVEYNTISECLVSDHIPVYMIVRMPATPPQSVINSKGYLIDRSTQLVEYGRNFKNSRHNRFALKVSSLMTYLLGLLLYFGTTAPGRAIVVTVLIVIYSLWTMGFL